ncbi:hypothetical protein PV-S19_0351 [Pacmanvirus S19]|nr:hypothetical protein PV-S19_0351 [Pacmanvirus S19]
MERRVKQNWDIKSVREFFNSKGCELLAAEYINTSTKMQYRCKCGDINESTMRNFQRYSNCYKCGRLASAENGRKWNIDNVKEYFKQYNCTLLTDYKNPHSPLSYICKCGKKATTNFAQFQESKQCPDCGLESRAAKRRTWTPEKLTEFYKEASCNLLTTDYKNKESKLKFICKCGEEQESTFAAFKKSKQCSKCGSNARAVSIKKSCEVRFAEPAPDRVKYIKEFFEKAGCTLLSDYKDIKTKLKYICKCGKEWEASFMTFKAAPWCKDCGTEKRKQTNLKKYGNEQVFGSEEIKKKSRETNLRKYGVTTALCKPEIRSKWLKSSYAMKEINISGKIFKCQGYESTIIQYLITNGISAEDIITEDELCQLSQMPEFCYELDGKKHRYFPDLFIKSQNKFIEVKSIYTMNINPEKVLAKADCVFYNDYKIDIYVLNEKKEIVNIISY